MPETGAPSPTTVLKMRIGTRFELLLRPEPDPASSALSSPCCPHTECLKSAIETQLIARSELEIITLFQSDTCSRFCPARPTIPGQNRPACELCSGIESGDADLPISISGRAPRGGDGFGLTEAGTALRASRRNRFQPSGAAPEGMARRPILLSSCVTNAAIAGGNFSPFRNANEILRRISGMSLQTQTSSKS